MTEYLGVSIQTCKLEALACSEASRPPSSFAWSSHDWWVTVGAVIFLVFFICTAPKAKLKA